MHSRTVRTAAASLVSRDCFSSADALRRERVDFACGFGEGRRGKRARAAVERMGKEKTTDRASLDRLHQGGGYFDLGVVVCEGTTCRMQDGIRNRRREAWEDELCHL